MMNSIKMILSSLSTLGCIASALVLMIVIMELKNNVGAFLMPVDRSTVDTFVTGLRKAGRLKPYKMITGGFGREERVEGGKKATLDYQYKGFAEYSVNLEELVAEVREDRLVVTLPAPQLEDPRALEMKDPRLWNVETSFGMGHWKERFRTDEAMILNDRILADVSRPENLEKAKHQTESILSYMFSPLINPKKITYKWL